jgi:ubiquinone biosynthesis protein
MLLQALVAVRDLSRLHDIASVAMPILEQSLRARYTPTAIIKRGGRAISETLTLIAGLPRDLSRLLHSARRGRLEIHIELPT